MSSRPYLPLLESTLKKAPIVWRGDYPYFVHPLSDGVPAIEPALVREVTEALVALTDLDCDYILTPEAMGLPLGTALSLRTGLPLNIVRKRSYGLEGEVEVDYQTGYGQGKLYLNGVQAGDRVLLVDDVVSTGGTLKALVAALNELKVEIAEVLVVFEKCDLPALQNELEMTIRTLIKVEVDREGQLQIID